MLTSLRGGKRKVLCGGQGNQTAASHPASHLRVAVRRVLARRLSDVTGATRRLLFRQAASGNTREGRLRVVCPPLLCCRLRSVMENSAEEQQCAASTDTFTEIKGSTCGRKLRSSSFSISSRSLQPAFVSLDCSHTCVEVLPHSFTQKHSLNKMDRQARFTLTDSLSPVKHSRKCI